MTRPPELRLHLDGLVVDNFAGGGGASTGIARAIGRSPDIAARFDSRVDRSGDCWLWTGGYKRRRGGALSYGVFNLGKRGDTMLAHRAAWELVHGPIDDDAVVCHRCDTPLCARVAACAVGCSTSREPCAATIKRCVGFARRWGCGSLAVVNLFAFRATHPADLLLADVQRHIVGPDNDDAIASAAADAEPIVVAWGGVAAPLRWRITQVRGLLAIRTLFALGLTDGGDPKHPLARGRHRVPDDARLVELR